MSTQVGAAPLTYVGKQKEESKVDMLVGMFVGCNMGKYKNHCTVCERAEVEHADAI